MRGLEIFKLFKLFKLFKVLPLGISQRTTGTLINCNESVNCNELFKCI